MFTEITTPALVLDQAALERNLGAMRDLANAAGISLRPHLKTAKCVEIAEQACAGAARAITVSTLAEARFFAAANFMDQTYAVGFAAHKMAEVDRLRSEYPGLSLSILTDDVEAARAISQAATEGHEPTGVWIEIDCGDHRAGVPWHDRQGLRRVAEVIDGSAGLTLAGVLTHAGHSYAARSLEAAAAIAEDERQRVVTAAQSLRHDGFDVVRVSAGSTPTAVAGAQWAGVDELRPGVYMFGDITQCAIGVCEAEDIAVSVLATITSHHRAAGHVVIDAGALALSKDLGVGESGYGWVCDVRGRRMGELVVDSVSQEHGLIAGDIDFETLAVGSRVRIVPNHACMMAAGHSGYHVIRDGRVVAHWPRCAGYS